MSRIATVEYQFLLNSESRTEIGNFLVYQNPYYAAMSARDLLRGSSLRGRDFREHRRLQHGDTQARLEHAGGELQERRQR